jgi:hypothetical protein
MTDNNCKILLDLIDIVMGNQPLKTLSITDLAFNNNYIFSSQTSYNNINNGYVQEIEYLFKKLNMFVYNNDFSNVYYLWNNYKYNLEQRIHENFVELENELWGVLLNAELITENNSEYESDFESEDKKDIEDNSEYESDFESEDKEDIEDETIEEQANEDEMIEEQANEHETIEDETNEEQAIEDETNEEQANEEQAIEDETNEEQEIEDETNEEQANEEQAIEDETNEEQAIEDETNEEQANEEQAIEDETNEEQANEDETIEEQAIEDKEEIEVIKEVIEIKEDKKKNGLNESWCIIV